MSRVAFLAYGFGAYASFLGVFLYAVGFLGGFRVPKSIDSGPVGPIAGAALVNVGLLALFGLQHSVMARQGFKAWWTKMVPQPVERSTYVLFSSLALMLLFWQWRPMPAVVWHVEHPAGCTVLWGLFACGFLIALYSSFLIDHLHLFGLRQVFLHLRGKEATDRPFAAPSLYRLVRHPLYVGWITACWSTPHMTQGHLLFSLGVTAYILIAIPLEERDLVRSLGEAYRRYRQQTPMLLPWPRRG